MGDFYEQAQAIWKALDEMSEQDPEGYRKFVSEQLKQGKDRFSGGTGGSGNKPLHTKDSGSNASSRAQKQSVSGVSQDAPVALEGLAKLSLGDFGKDEITSAKGFSGSGSKGRNDNDDVSQCGGGDAPNLLDDEIGGKSILAKIVKDSERQVPSKIDGGEDDDEVLINELVIPSSVCAPSKPKSCKSLIEEV